MVQRSCKQNKIMTLEQELEDLKSEISKLFQRKAEVEKKLMESATDFKTKLRLWINSTNKDECPWIPDEDDYPKLASYIEDMDLDRYRTYDIYDFFEDRINCYLEDDEIDPNFLEVLEEAVEKNLGSFTYDW